MPIFFTYSQTVTHNNRPIHLLHSSRNTNYVPYPRTLMKIHGLVWEGDRATFLQVARQTATTAVEHCTVPGTLITGPDGGCPSFVPKLSTHASDNNENLAQQENLATDALCRTLCMLTLCLLSPYCAAAPTAQLGIGPEPDKAEGWAKAISAKVKELFGLPASWRPKGHRVSEETAV